MRSLALKTSGLPEEDALEKKRLTVGQLQAEIINNFILSVNFSPDDCRKGGMPILCIGDVSRYADVDPISPHLAEENYLNPIVVDTSDDSENSLKGKVSLIKGDIADEGVKKKWLDKFTGRRPKLIILPNILNGTPNLYNGHEALYYTIYKIGKSDQENHEDIIKQLPEILDDDGYLVVFNNGEYNAMEIPGFKLIKIEAEDRLNGSICFYEKINKK